MNIIAVALGGATGSLFRYFISLIPIKTEFPFLTFITNILGAMLIGLIFGLSTKNGLDKTTTLFWQTGVCGGFTTFSTFSLETYKLFLNEDYLTALIYIVLSIMCCLFGVFIGISISRFLSNLL